MPLQWSEKVKGEIPLQMGRDDNRRNVFLKRYFHEVSPQRGDTKMGENNLSLPSVEE